MVAVVEVDGDDPGLARVGEGGEGGFLDRARARRHEDEVFFVESLHRQHGGDLFAFDEREKIDDGPAARGARAFGHFVDPQPIAAAPAGEAQHCVMGVGDEELVDEVFVLHRGGLFAAPAAPLGAVIGEWLALEVAGVRERHHHVFGRDQVFEVDFGGVEHDFGAARVVELVFHRVEFVDDDRGDARRTGEDVEQVGDDFHDFAVFGDDLVLFQAGEPLEAKFENRLRLRFREPVALGREAEFGG